MKIVSPPLWNCMCKLRGSGPTRSRGPTAPEEPVATDEFGEAFEVTAEGCPEN